MKKLIVTLACSSMALGAFAASDPASAQFRGLRDAVRDVKKTTDDAKDVAEAADEVARTVSGNRSNRSSGTRPFSRGSTSASPSSAQRRSNAGNAGAAPSNFMSQLSCASLGLGNAFVARAGDYTFSKGIRTETRGGLIDRRNVTPTSGCMFEGLGVGDVLYVEFDKNRFKERDYDMQCVSFDGSEQLSRATRPPVNNYKGKDVMLHTGHSLGYTPTASGSNSSRSGAYDDYLAGRGRAMATVNFGALHTDPGTDFFCQWYSESTGKSAFALTYRRGPSG